MNLFRKHSNLTLIVLLQAVLVGVTFSPLIKSPNNFLFQVKGDGIKNYFTYLAYLRQPFDQGLLKFEQFNYPYGEYLFYTDNTPVLALAVKLFSHYIFDVTAHGLLIYHLFLMSGIVISTVLVYLILQRLIHNTFLIGFFSLVLPWVHPQILRLEAGHHNLSFAFVVLSTILFLRRSYQKFYTGNKILPELFWFLPVVIICSFIHLYYLPVVLVFVGFFCATWLVKAYRQRANYRLLLGWTATLLLVPLSIVYSIIRLTDGYYELRGPGAGGYDANITKLFMQGLFTPYFVTDLSLIFNPNNPVLYKFSIESNAYLGSFALATAILLVFYFLKINPTKTAGQQKDLAGLTAFFRLFAFAALGCLLISFGDKIHFTEDDYGIPNYLNLFWYLKQVTVSITHFRQLGRFSWIFFWFFNFWIIYLFEQFLFHRQRKIAIQFAAYAFLGLAVLDMVYVQIRYRKNLYPLTLIPAGAENSYFLRANFKPANFQAILPLPFYHIGCETEGYFFTVDNPFFLQTVQLSLSTQLPLMASNMSRSATSQVQAFYETITTGKVSPDLLPKLNQKPILVAIDTRFYNEKPSVYTQITGEKARAVFEAGRTFIQKHGLQHVGRYQHLALYSWRIKL